jgi:hypothetical protein
MDTSVLFKEENGGFEFQLDLRPHKVDNLFIVKLPTEFIPYESDRFRAKTEDSKKMISITNYRRPWNGEVINKQFFEELKLRTYDKFVNEGGYEAYDDLKATDEFIRKSFKVDEETQYYFTSARIMNDNFVITEFIIREIGAYNRHIMPTLEIINDLIEYENKKNSN